MVRGVVLLLDDDDTRFASRLPSFPCLPPLIFLYFIISVYSYRVCLRVYPSLCLAVLCVSFFLSLSFSSFRSFFGGIFLPRVLREFARACFPYAWSGFFLPFLRKGGVGVVLRLGDSFGMLATRMTARPNR